MPNQVKENKSEKKFKGEVLEINDKLLIISWLFVFVFFIWNLFVGNHDPHPRETGWGRDQFVRIYLVKKGFIKVIWSYCKFLKFFVYNFTVFRNDITLFILFHFLKSNFEPTQIVKIREETKFSSE